MSDPSNSPASPSGDGLSRSGVLLATLVFLTAVGMAVALHWPALTHYGAYKEDILQSPHWAGYHTSSFQPDDPILRYASFNESPLQNAIYWVATWFLEYVALSKVLAVLSYGLLSLCFFLVGRAMYGTRFGLLLAMFITFFPDQWDYSAGFFSKFWAIPLLLICVFLLQTGRFKGLIALLPFGALAYPTVAVIIGMTASVYWLMEVAGRREGAARLFRYLAIGSALAVALLMVKYVSPPDLIGPMRSGEELRKMPELRDGGFPSHYIPIPSLNHELIRYVRPPFVLITGILFFLVLGRKGIGWERSWTALFIASAIGYLLADLLFMHLYIPNRYTRYSMAVLLALWNARNWDLILARVRFSTARYALVVVLLLAGGYAYSDDYREGRGWTDRTAIVPVSRFIRESLPERILVAGSPRRLDDVMIQARRSVLVPYKLSHPWFVDYYGEIRERTKETLRAHFASRPEQINALHDRYGVTHFLVDKSLLERALEGRVLYASPYSSGIYAWLDGRRDFYLRWAPRELFLYEDGRFAVLELPIPVSDDGAP